MKTNNILTPLLLIFLFSQVKSNLFNKIDFTSEKQILFESYLDNIHYIERFQIEINPNPFSSETKINYYIPNELKGNAELMLTDEKGISIINKLEACIGIPCSITISSDNLQTGVYVYALVLNGKIIKSQKMMIIK